MSNPDGSNGFFKRNLLGLWFCGLAFLGGVRFHLASIHSSQQQPELTMRAWLVGSTVLGFIGLVMLLRDRKQCPVDRRPESTKRGRG